jgi:hypothetical protein
MWSCCHDSTVEVAHLFKNLSPFCISEHYKAPVFFRFTNSRDRHVAIVNREIKREQEGVTSNGRLLTPSIMTACQLVSSTGYRPVMISVTELGDNRTKRCL